MEQNIDPNELIKYEFPRPISNNEIILLLSYLSQKGYEFNGTQSGFISSQVSKMGCTIEDYINHIHGNFRRKQPFGITSVSFSSQDSKDYPSFSKLIFNTTVGYNWIELQEHERRIISDLKKDLDSYFNDH